MLKAEGEIAFVKIWADVLARVEDARAVVLEVPFAETRIDQEIRIVAQLYVVVAG